MSWQSGFCHIYWDQLGFMNLSFPSVWICVPPLYWLLFKGTDAQIRDIVGKRRQRPYVTVQRCVQVNLSELWSGFWDGLDGLKIFGYYIRYNLSSWPLGCDPAGKCKRGLYIEEIFGYNHLGTQWQSQTFPGRRQIWMPGRDCCCCSLFSLGPGFLEDWLVMAH